MKNVIYVILGISLTLNVICIIGLYFYIKYKVLGMNKLKKDLKKQFVSDDELNDMLDRL